MTFDKGNLNSLVFLDIKKAFDTANHDFLIKVLNRDEISNGELSFIASYLSQQTQFCHVDENENASSLKLVTFGVSQGSILGPLLFILYLDDLPIAIRTSNVSMRADDTFLSKDVGNYPEIRQKLIPGFPKIYDWLKANKLSRNILKTKFMIMGNSGKFDTAAKCNACTLDFGEPKKNKHAKMMQFAGIFGTSAMQIIP